MKRKHLLGGAVLILLITAYVYLKTQTTVLEVFTTSRIQAYVEGKGAAGPIFFMAIQAVAVIFSQLPNIPLTMAAGAIWGPVLGTVYSVIGALTGGCIAFFIARALGVDIVKKIIGDNYKIIEELPEDYLTIGIFVTRLLPFLSFDVISYGAGLTEIDFRNFFLATLLGMIPGAFLFAYLGKSVVVGTYVSWILTGLVVIFMVFIPWYLNKQGVIDY